MPIHVAPFFRERELALEAAGLIPKINSDAYNAVVAEENAGTRAKNLPQNKTFNYNGNTYVAK